ncbi:MAG: phage holin family protein [Desulfobacterales bacterium]
MNVIDNSLKQLFADLIEEIRSLIRNEINLAKAEMAEKTTSAVKNTVAVIIGGAVIYMGVLVLLAAVVFALSTVVSMWAAALIVGVVVTLAGIIAAMTGLKHLKQFNVVPEHTASALRDDKKWLKDEMHGINR